LTTARSWKEAKEIADREGTELVFHNFDTGTYGACSRSQVFGYFKDGIFIEYRCICVPAQFTIEEIEGKEKEFLKKNLEWE